MMATHQKKCIISIATAWKFSKIVICYVGNTFGSRIL